MSEVSASTEISKEPMNNDRDKNVETSEEQPEETSLANDDVRRAIEGLAEIPDDQLQEFLNDEDFMEGLDVVDAWEGDVDKTTKPSRRPRTRDRDRTKSSRERPRRDRRSSYNRDRARKDERKREDTRRDPSKSSKDIERDKMRTRKDTASKILAEKEKAIKHLLDSDDVVPPGTEVEVIKDITEKQLNSERTQPRGRRSRERRRLTPQRRRSSDRNRSSPSRRNSEERRQTRISQERRRPVASPPLRKSWERRASRERSLERQRRREERELRLASRRSRSRDRQRSRTGDRQRSRSGDRQRSRSGDRYRKRWSRSPNGRRLNPRRHSRSRTPDRRARKRSPFINEITRQFGAEGLMPGGSATGFLPGIPPLMGTAFTQDQTPSSVPPPLMQQFMHHPGPPGPSGVLMQGGGGPPFVNFEPRSQLGPPMNFEPGRGPLLHTPQTDYSSGPIIYNQGNPPRPMQQPIIGPPILSVPVNSPQPVPAPAPTSDHQPMSFDLRPPNIPASTQHSESSDYPSKSPKPTRMPYKDLKTTSFAYNGVQSKRPDRLKTPEPPVISNSKPFEKTSLSSLLEASVSAKDSFGPPVLYPGFKPEILRQCEIALRDLPSEDLRFKTKGRFFFDPSKKDQQPEPENSTSNSILLRTGRNKIYWESGGKSQHGSTDTMRPIVETHQKICQTEEPETESRGVQAVILPKTAEFCVQVYPKDLQQAAKEEKRPIMDRLDWNVRDTYDYAPKVREADDLRWSLSNSSQKRTPYNRGLSPVLVLDEDHRMDSPPLITLDHGSRGLNAGSSSRVRDAFSYDRSSSREHYSNERFSPTYRRSTERREDYHNVESNHSRGESPMALAESPDEVEIVDEEHYSRGSDWRTHGSSSFGSSSALQKLRALRGKSSARPYRGRGSFRGKF